MGTAGDLAGAIPDGVRTLELLDTAYRIDTDDRVWLRNVARAANDVIGHGCGVHAYYVDLSSSEVRIDEPLFVGGSPAWQRRWREDWWEPFIARMDSDTLRWLHGFGVCSFATDLWDAGARFATLSEYLSAMAATRWGRTHARYALPGQRPGGSSPVYPDSFNLIAVDATGRGCVLIANLAQVAPRLLTAGEVAFWGRLAAHLAAALRLRRRFRARNTAAALQDAEALIDGTGRVAHAAGRATAPRAREALREAARRLDAARTQRLDARERLSLWRALTAGRWSVCDAFDSDGRRFVIARPNEPSAPAGALLSERERQVVAEVALGRSNKLIGYELGISPSTVSAHLATASRKLQVRSRLELIRAARRLRVDDGTQS